MEMYKMLIAEQDKNQLEALCEFTSSKFKQIKIVRTEETGYAVLDYISKNQVEIIVISINLLGISGLEVARRVKKLQPEIHIVMISEYDYSDFLMEAMSFGISDYLLKPLNMLEYSNVISKMVEELDSKKHSKAKRNKLEIHEDRKNIFLDYCFIYSFMWNDKSSYQIKFYQDILGIDSYGYILNMEIERKGEGCAVDVDRDFMIISQGIKDVLSQSVTCVVGPQLGKRIIVYVSQNEVQFKNKEAVTEALALANKLRFEMVRCFHLEVRIGIGSTKKISEVHDSYEESIKSLRYMLSSGVTHIKDVSPSSICHKDYIELENSFFQNARLGKSECIEQFGFLWEMLKTLNIYDAKNKILEMLAILCREVRLQAESEVNNLDYTHYVEEMKGLDWSQLKQWSYSKVEYILKAVRTSRGMVKSVAVKEAMSYINDHYKEDLTLGFMAKLVNMTPQHFSKIFKEGTKTTYIRYLRKVRVEHAKELLLQGDMAINEISDATGFHDSNYFSRMFKREEGKSPSQFVALEMEGTNSNS